MKYERDGMRRDKNREFIYKIKVGALSQSQPEKIEEGFQQSNLR